MRTAIALGLTAAVFTLITGCDQKTAQDESLKVVISLCQCAV